MSTNDLKIYGFNSITMAISFTNLENTLKIILLLVSIVYTMAKTFQLISSKYNNEQEDKE